MCSQEGRSYLVHAERVAAGAVHPDVVPVPGRRTVHQKVLGSRWPARGELLAYLCFPLVNVHGNRQRMHMKHRQTTCGCTRNPSPSSTGSCTTHSSDAQGVHCQHSRSVYLVLYLTMYSWSGSNRATPALPAPKHGSIRQNPHHMDPSGNARAQFDRWHPGTAGPKTYGPPSTGDRSFRRMDDLLHAVRALHTRSCVRFSKDATSYCVSRLHTTVRALHSWVPLSR